MALVSPGLQVTVTDESQYISNAVGTVPLVVMATAQDKTINGVAATGTSKTNAGALQIFGSQRELSTAMGYPVFQQSSAGTPLHGNELNEYGLMAAYSALGVNNQVFAVRADIDLNELQGTSVRPTAAVSDGTYWFDTADTSWGIYEWSADAQSFTAKTPIVITSSSQVTTANTQGVFTGGSGYAYTPLQSIGSIGQYAVVATDSSNRVYYKAGNDLTTSNTNYNKWLLVGTPAWHASHPAITGNVTSATFSLTTTSTNYYMVFNTGTGVNAANVQIPIGTTYTLANVSTAINSAAITGVTADVVNGKLVIYTDGTSSSFGNTTIDGKVRVSAPAGAALSILGNVGITAGTYVSTAFQSSDSSEAGYNPNGYGTFVDVPPWTNNTSIGDYNAPNGSVWLKTGATGGGSDFVFKKYNSTTGLWNTQAINTYPSEVGALYSLDPLGGGQNIAVGTIYMNEDPNTYSIGSLGYSGWKARVRNVAGAVSAVGISTAPTFTVGSQFTIAASVAGATIPTTVTATITSTTADASAFVAAVQAAAGSVSPALPVTAQVNANGSITITHTQGGRILLSPVGGTYNAPSSALFGNNSYSAGLGTVNNVSAIGTGTTAVFVISGFSTLSYTVGSSIPVADPADGTHWYFSDPTVVDIMINTGTAWRGYQNVTSDARGYNLANTDPVGVIAAAISPSTQSDGSALVSGDLWLNTADLENWPALSRWNGSAWIAIDNTDQITTNGILFADARWDSTGATDPASGDETSIVTLLTSDYLDLDAPNPLLYPRGMLLLNTRRSGYNVKKYVNNYFNTTADNVANYSNATTYAKGAKVQAGGVIYVSLSTNNTGNAVSNTTYWAPLNTSTWVTTSGLKTNGSPYAGHNAQRQVIVAALKSALDSNTEIREDQFKFSLICAPGYPELIPNMISLNNDRANTAFVIGDTPMTLSTNVVGITNWSNNTNGDGLATNDPYLGVYYPSGLSTDLGGNTIMVPPSHMALRTFLYNDNVAYPWFAPAGTRRGLVSNATDLGYLDTATGEFVRTGVNQALRDSLYQLKINPVTIIPGIGLVVWGQKTRDPNTEAMDRINVARLVNYVRTIFASAGNAFLFEPNDKITRDQFAAVLNRALNDLVAKRGIYDYLVVCDTTNNTPDRIANNQLYADVAIEPMKDVEFIYIPVRLFNPGDIATLGSK